MAPTRILILPSALALGAILLLALLLPLANWQADEFGVAAIFRDWGVNGFILRVTTWSPRPFSEALLYTYFAIATALRQPLATPFLGTLWIASIALIMWPAWRTNGPRSVSITAGLSLIALCFLSRGNTELLYWPQGSAAYLPTAAGILATVIATVLQRPRNGGFIAFSLLLAALSSELGAIFVAAHTGSLLIMQLFQKRFRPDSRWLLFPALAALAVIAAFLSSRFGFQEEIGVSKEIWASLRSALLEFPAEVITSQAAARDWGTLVVGGLAKVFALFGFALLLGGPKSRSDMWDRIHLAFVCMAMAFVTIFLSYYQFGAMCCERQGSLRQVLIYASIVAAASALGINKAFRVPLAAVVLTLSIGIAGALVVPSAIRDLSNRKGITADDMLIWHTGLAPTGNVILPHSVHGEVIRGAFPNFEPKVYPKGDLSAPWQVQSLWMFFGKDVEVTSPE